jgi:hypothetical protein
MDSGVNYENIHIGNQTNCRLVEDSGHPVPFSTVLALNLMDQLRNCFQSSNPLKFIFKTTGCPLADGELNRFRYALYAYQESVSPVLTTDFLISGLIQGPDFVTYLKRLRSKSFVHSINGYFVEPSDELDKITPITITDIGQIFCFRYYFFWDQPDEEDWKYFFEPLTEVDPKDLDRFEETVFMMLPDSVETVFEEEILLECSGSKSLQSDPLGRTEANWKVKERQNFFSDKPLHGKGSYIQKCPGDTRFSITLSVPHSNSVKLIEKQFALIAQEVPFSNYVKDENIFEKNFNTFHNTFKKFFCRDLKKDGITKVRSLVQRVCRACERKYPNLPAMKYTSIYDDFSFSRNGVIYHPPRGVGLGMSSAITTILQSAILKITLEDLYYSDRIISGQISGLFYHDDCEIGFTEIDDFHEYNEVEDLVMERYGQIKNKKKSFIGDSGVLCERYVRRFNKKDSMLKYLLRLPFSAVNITHAKNIWIQGFHHFERLEWLPYLNDLIDYWGYEFVPNEVRYPLSFGGWIPSRFSSVDTSFVSITEDTKNLYALMNASRLQDLPYKGKDSDNRPYNSPFNQIYGPLETGGYDRIYLSNLTINDMGRIFKSRDKFGTTKNYWTYNFNKRQEIWYKTKSVECDIQTLYDSYIEIHSGKDVLPPKCLISDSGIDLTVLESGFKFHSTTNPRLSYLKFLNPDKINDKVMPSPVPPGISLLGRKGLTTQERRDILDLEFASPDEDFFGYEFTIPTYKIKTAEWFDPNSVISACMNYYSRYILPKGKIKKSLLGLFDLDTRIFDWLYSPTYRLYETIVRMFGMKRALDLDYEILWDDLLENHLRKQNELKQAHLDKLKRLKNTDSSPGEDNESYHEANFEGWSDSPLKDDDYFVWLTEKNQKPHFDWRYSYFDSIYQKYNTLFCHENIGDAVGNVKVDRNPDYKLTEVEAHLYLRSGGKIDSEGYPIISTQFDWLDKGSGDSEESLSVEMGWFG